MENTTTTPFANDLAPLPEKPQLLKVLCILSFIACGLTILCCALGTMLLGIDEETRNQTWERITQLQPQLEGMDPALFFHQFGMVCLYTLFANIVSLVGVILMWNLNKIGFFIYVAAELSVHFFGMTLSAKEEEKSYGGTIFGILVDLIFIVLYAMNLKYMNKKESI